MNDYLLKFLAGGALWFAIGLWAFWNWRTNLPGAWNVFKAMLLYGSICGLPAILMPKILWPYFHIFAWPFICLLLAVFLSTRLANKHPTA